jgi:hypothetical protein
MKHLIGDSLVGILIGLCLIFFSLLVVLAFDVAIRQTVRDEIRQQEALRQERELRVKRHEERLRNLPQDLSTP